MKFMINGKIYEGDTWWDTNKFYAKDSVSGQTFEWQETNPIILVSEIEYTFPVEGNVTESITSTGCCLRWVEKP